MTSTTPPANESRALAGLRLLVWPVFILVALLLFHSPLSVFIRNLGKAEFKRDQKGNITIALEVAANLGAAAASRSESSGGESSSGLTGVPAAALRAAGSPVLGSARILWVDDNPTNNLYERAALAAVGVEFELAMNTAEAMERLRKEDFDLVISDFERQDDPRGGYTLLAELAKLGRPAPPLIIYSSSASPEFERDAKARGAFGETNSPQRLFDLSINAILGK